MKLLYTLLALSALSIGGYFIANSTGFDSGVFSTLLIESLFAFMMCGLAVVGIGVFVSFKRKHNYKDVMTIRQYYDYKSAR